MTNIISDNNWSWSFEKAFIDTVNAGEVLIVEPTPSTSGNIYDEDTEFDTDVDSEGEEMDEISKLLEDFEIDLADDEEFSGFE